MEQTLETKVEDVKSVVPELKSSVTDSKSAVADVKPSVTDVKSVVTDVKSAVQEVKFVAPGVKSGGRDVKPKVKVPEKRVSRYSERRNQRISKKESENNVGEKSIDIDISSVDINLVAAVEGMSIDTNETIASKEEVDFNVKETVEKDDKLHEDGSSNVENNE